MGPSWEIANQKFMTEDELFLSFQLAANSRPSGECLIWTGPVNELGYGTIQVNGHKEYIHRVAWMIRYGEPLAEAPYVLHRCDNPPCWRDEHLRLGTKADNTADMVSKGRHANQMKTHCPAGHEYSPDNTAIWGGRRNCRRCRNERRLSR